MKKIDLRSCDGEVFQVDEAVAVQSEAIKRVLHQDGWSSDEDEIFLDDVNAKTLAKVIDYCKKHAESYDHDEELKHGDARFIDDIDDQETLRDLAKAAKALEVNNLLTLVLSKSIGLSLEKPAPNEKALQDFLWTQGVDYAARPWILYPQSRPKPKISKRGTVFILARR